MQKKGWISCDVDDRIAFTEIIRDSSMVEQEAVNFEVLGSSPSRGAQKFLI